MRKIYGENSKTNCTFGAISGWNPTRHKRIGMLFTCSAFLLICKHLDKDVTCFASKSKILGEGQLAPLTPVSAGSAKYTTSAKDLSLYKKFLLFWLWSIEFDLEFLLQKM